MTSATADDRGTITAYPPTAEFAAQANADAALYERAAADRDAFWAEQARRLHWHEPF
ncbi:acetyl-coenzyme A synthetase N-terminal domain-containing protein, partial [Nocardia beijingensis]|uniref:acetyl-coenzyme A synthetase N-terminal domain-containing protein n=1 Tax=Nocardia beijingensis TaxID=95162 RepID=UPI002B4AC26F